MQNSDLLFFKMQAQIIELNLQLAEVEEKPKRAGDFETSYKTESGKEIIVKRSPDGKFANKSSNSTATVVTKPDNNVQLDPQVARENGKAVREILTGKVGDDLKKDLAADFEHRPIIKEAIEKTDFAEVTKGNADALTNISNFIQKKFDEAVNATSQLGREIAAAAIAVAGYTARWLAFGLALRGTLLVPASVGLIKQGETPKEVIKRVAELSPELIKEVFSLENIGRTARRGAIIEAIFRAIDLAVYSANKPQPPLIEPNADAAIAKALRGISGNAIKNGLLANAAQTPSVLEGIKNTSIDNIVKGSKDSFTDAVDFLRDKVQEATTATSEHKKEIAIGAAILSVGISASILGAALGIVSGAALGDIVTGLITGKGLTEVAKTALKKLTTGQFNRFSAEQLRQTAVAVFIGNMANKVIREETEKERIKKFAPTQGIRSFGDKEEAIKKLITDENLDYDKVLLTIARRKQKEENNNKNAEILKKEITKLDKEIQDGIREVKDLFVGKTVLVLTPSEQAKVLAIAKKEAEIRNKLVEKRGELDAVEGRGFSVDKRLSELLEIAEKEGKASPSYKWRLNVVKAEIEYGEKLDDLDKLGGYRKLLDSMKKPKPAIGSYERPGTLDNNRLRTVFRAGVSPSQTPESFHNEIIANAQKEGLDLQNYLSTPINAQVGLNSGMTCAIASMNNKYAYLMEEIVEIDPGLKGVMELDMFKGKNIDGYINIGDVAVNQGSLKLQGYNTLSSTNEHIKEMMWHESGHLLEVKLGKVEESAAFREDRAKEVPNENKVVPERGLSMGSQDYALGEFYSPYIGLRLKGMGKHTDTDRMTEVLSSGMELLSSPAMAKRAAKADRETMLYALAAMNEKVKD